MQDDAEMRNGNPLCGASSARTSSVPLTPAVAAERYRTAPGTPSRARSIAVTRSKTNDRGTEAEPCIRGYIYARSILVLIGCHVRSANQAVTGLTAER
jgi:hypothetical protein